MARNEGRHRVSRRTKIVTGVAAVALAAGGVAFATTQGGSGSANADAADKAFFVDITTQTPNVKTPQNQKNASTGTFTVDCGKNENKHFNPDNFIAQPGIKNGAQHLHDYVGNLTSNADSNNASLLAGGTTCKNGDQSAYFWPVIRIDTEDDNGGENGGENQQGQDDTAAQQDAAIDAAVTPRIDCPDVASKLGTVPDAAMPTVDAELGNLDKAAADANKALTDADAKGDTGAQTAAMNSLRDKRSASVTKMKQAGAQLAAPGDLAACGVKSVTSDGIANGDQNSDGPDQRAAADQKRRGHWTPHWGRHRGGHGGNNGGNNGGTGGNGGSTTTPPSSSAAATTTSSSGETSATGSSSAQPTESSDAQGTESSDAQATESSGAEETGSASATSTELSGTNENGEVGDNDGEIQEPATVDLTFRGSPTGKVTAMPQFLRILEGDAKQSTNGPKNARASWTCTGMENIIMDKYPICPEGAKVERIHDFPSCWDGQNIDSANHRDHIAFPDANGKCQQGFTAVPQLRVTLTYDIPRDIQVNGQYKVDAFAQEEHNPLSDHDDFANVMSQQIMWRVVNCINTGRSCKE